MRGRKNFDRVKRSFSRIMWGGGWGYGKDRVERQGGKVRGGMIGVMLFDLFR